MNPLLQLSRSLKVAFISVLVACTPVDRVTPKKAQNKLPDSSIKVVRQKGSPHSDSTLENLHARNRPQATRGRFVAKKSLGVPLHAQFRQRKVVGRAANGENFEVLETRDDGHWVKVKLSSSAQGQKSDRQLNAQVFWVIDDYLQLDVTAEKAERSDWSLGDAQALALKSGLAQSAPSFSREACLASMSRGVKARPVGAGTFNIRWFPNGKPGKKGPQRVDTQWLACEMSHLGVPIIALQEMKRTAGAVAALAEVIEYLNQNGSADFEAIFDDCSGAALQHVGLLYDRKRVVLNKRAVLGALNPHGQACEKSLRPGLLGEFTFLDDQSKLNVVSVHLKSGTKTRDHRLREETMRAIQRRAGPATLYVGDFNTMGCTKCSRGITAKEERDSLESLGQGEFIEVKPSCSQYYRGAPGLLDGGFVRGELKQKVWKGLAGGLCRDLNCQPASVSRFSYSRQVSDHCPLAFFPAP